MVPCRRDSWLVIATIFLPYLARRSESNVIFRDGNDSESKQGLRYFNFDIKTLKMLQTPAMIFQRDEGQHAVSVETLFLRFSDSSVLKNLYLMHCQHCRFKDSSRLFHTRGRNLSKSGINVSNQEKVDVVQYETRKVISNVDFPTELRVSSPRILAKIRLKPAETGPGLLMEGGLYKYALDALAKYKNVTVIPILSSGGGTGLPIPNTTRWSGVVGDLLDNKADLGIVTAITYQRSLIIDFSYPLEYQEMKFVIGKPQRIYTWKTIFWPFQKTFWLTIIAFAGLVTTVLAQMPTESVQNLASYRRTGWIKGVMLVFKGLVDQTERVPRNGYSREVFMLWLLLTLNLSATYKSRFFSLLTIPITDDAPRSFESLSASDYKVGLHYLGGAAFHLLKTSRNPALQKIIHNHLDIIPGPIKCYKNAALVRKSACIGWNGFIEYVLAANFSDRFGNNPFLESKAPAFVSPIAFSVRKGSWLQKPMSEFTLRAVAGGLQQYWTDFDLKKVGREGNEWRKRNKVFLPSDASNLLMNGDNGGRISKLSLNNLIGCFAIWIFGTMLAIFSSLVETISFCGMYFKWGFEYLEIRRIKF